MVPVGRGSYTSGMATEAPPPESEDRAARFRSVARVINALRPSIQADGGDVELVDLLDDGTVRIRLHGACVGCPSSEMTLRDGLERNLREHVGDIRAVVAVE